MQHPDVCIAGAGIIGLSLALELARRGVHVTVLERGDALGEASSAAAGMLAGNDPGNPPLLRPLAEFSLARYPAYLDHIANLADVRVPFQTELTLQATAQPTASSLSRGDLDIFVPSHNLLDRHMTLLDEHSIDPRQLGAALRRAAENTSIELLTQTAVLGVVDDGRDVRVRTAETEFGSRHFVDCTGAWSTALSGAVSPRKGQMLSVALPQSAPLSLVVRTEEMYVVPRTTGPNAGRAIIGATVEDAGFDKAVHGADVRRLQEEAERLLPALAGATVLEEWAGLRPATADELPILGALGESPRHLFATGHFRNGILLAPATAHLMAQVVLGESPEIDLACFAPGRFRSVAGDL